MVLQITPVERVALQLLAEGWTATALASRLGMNEREIEVQLRTLFTKMGASSQTEALAAALRRGLVQITAPTAGTR